jgi:hypothetical protein
MSLADMISDGGDAQQPTPLTKDRENMNEIQKKKAVLHSQLLTKNYSINLLGLPDYLR